jgi:enoyl-CoA hydratase/carnithine racemase
MKDGVGLIRLARPEALNTLNFELMRKVVAAAADMDKGPGIGAILLTCSDTAFAAGAEMILTGRTNAIKTATLIAGMSAPVAMLAEESVNAAFQSDLSAGIPCRKIPGDG